jgi:hypothetical protein
MDNQYNQYAYDDQGHTNTTKMPFKIITAIVVVCVIIFISVIAYILLSNDSSDDTPVKRKPTIGAGSVNDIAKVPPAPASSFYGEIDSYDYPGNDVSLPCNAGGIYNNIDDIYKACDSDPSCKGFSMRDGKPWCMKNRLVNGRRADNHTFYIKNGIEDEDPPRTASSFYNKIDSYDYPGNDVSLPCNAGGIYNNIEDISKACDSDPSCKGFSMRDGKPWCMKNGLVNGRRDDNHTFYVK